MIREADLAAFEAYQQRMRYLFEAARASLEPLRQSIAEACARLQQLNREKRYVKVD